MISFWRRGPVWGAVRLGATAGATYGLFWLLAGRSPANAAVSGALFGVVMGAFGAVRAWRQWPAARELASSERVEIARAVRHGTALDDPRLAPALRDFAAMTRRTHERERRYAWVLWLFAILAALLAIAKTANGSVSGALAWWALVAFWMVMLVLQPRRRARLLANAARAEAAAGEPAQELPQANAAFGLPDGKDFHDGARWPLLVSLGVLGLLACFVLSFGLTVLALVLLAAVVAAGAWTRKQRSARSARVLVWVAAVLFIARLLIPGTIVRTVVVGSVAMEPTIALHDRVMFNRLAGFGIGDVVAFHAPKDAHRLLCGPVPHPIEPGGAACASPEHEWKRGFWVRRVVAGPGDVISIVDGQVFRDGAPERSRYVTPCHLRRCNFPRPIRIPAGMWFLMSDNRREADDSRFFGPVPGSWIIGPAILRTWPPAHVGTLR